MLTITKLVDILFKMQNVKDVDSKMLKRKNAKIMLSPKCAVCSSEKSRFIKEQEATELLSRLGVQAPLSNIPLLGKILF